MTESTEGTGGEEKRSAATDDRFEVKWRKKNEPSTPPPTAEAPAEGETVEDLRRQLQAERERANGLYERWQRAAADLANLRRRTEQERGEVEKFASLVLVQELLPVLDNFERALATIPGNLAMLTWIQGVMLIERHFRAILEHSGLTAIEAVGKPFTPYEHEAVSERETSEAPSGIVLQEYQRGYTMHGRVIRPALVEVATAPSGAAEAHNETSAPPSGEEIAEEAETENPGP